MAKQRSAETADLTAVQCAALCWRRRKGHLQVLLITSRRTKRWVLPKGWPMAGLTSAETARTEAWEEAGVAGRIGQSVIGLYSYVKIAERPGQVDRPVMVNVHALKVDKLHRRFPEAHERRRRWISPRRAAEKVAEPELAALLRRIAKDGLPQDS